MQGRVCSEGVAGDVTGEGRQGLCDSGPDPLLSASCMKFISLWTRYVEPPALMQHLSLPLSWPSTWYFAFKWPCMLFLGLDTTHSLLLGCSSLGYPTDQLLHLLQVFDLLGAPHWLLIQYHNVISKFPLILFTPSHKGLTFLFQCIM